MNTWHRIRRSVLALVLMSIATGWFGCDRVGLFPPADEPTIPPATPSAQASSAATGPLFDYRKTELDNGLQVITLEDFSCPIVAVQLWYHVGSKDERPDRQGYAHMFEHMMFKGTDRVADDAHFKLINRVGGTLNAGTYFDWTFFYETVPADQVELALWLEAERMNFLRIDQEAFDTERKVVEEELRMGENRPYGTLMKKLLPAMFSVHPYRWPPIGNLAHLRATSVADLRSFWQRYYVPNNAVLVLVGAIPHDRALALAEEYFGWVPKQPAPPRVTVREPRWYQAKTKIIDDENAPAGLVSRVWRTVPRGHPDEVPLDLLAEVLGGGKSSRLYRELVADKQWAVEAQASTWNLEQDGLFFVDITQADRTDPNAIVASITRQVERLRTEPIDPAELTKARNRTLKAIVTQNLSVDSKARLLGSTTIETGDTEKVNAVLDEVRSVTVEELQAVARKYLSDEHCMTFIVLPNKKGMAAATKDDESAQVTAPKEINPPPPGRIGVKRPEDWPAEPPIGPLTPQTPMPKFTRLERDNGLTVLVVPNHEVPFVTVMLGLLDGAWSETKPGTANLAMQMLTRGTARHSEAELARILDENAISLSGAASMDTAAVQADCLTESLDLAMELLAEVVTEPTFVPEEFEKLQQQELTALAIQQADPRYQVTKVYRQALYGEHPYARTVSGEPEDVQALTVEDLRAWWASAMQPNKAVLIFAGDIEADRAVGLTDRYLGRWRKTDADAGRPEPPVLPEPPTIDRRRILLVDMPGSAQCQVRVGCRSITRHDQPDYFISRVVTNYFGGSFESRLNRRIRVEKGLTYGARGSYIARRFDGELTISTFTRTDAVAETVRTIFEELDRLLNEPPTDEELNDTKSYFLGSFVRSRETPQAVADDLWLIESNGLEPDYLRKLLERIAATTAQDCQALARRTIDPDRMIVVVTGDAAKIRPALEQIAPVTVITPATPAQPQPAGRP